MTANTNTSLDLSAVQICALHKSYGKFCQKKCYVLQDVDLSISIGTIYGLLGASGSGKTTLLRCIVGRLKPDHGIIRVFGEKPGSANCKIPGSGVGYMPQEIALYGEMTISETLTYFGRVHSMSRAKITERTEFLLEFLNLPKEWRLVKDLSGGQQRRVSFAIALLHQPPLLILDEPTVGVDPMLRMSIWDHLLEISQSGDVTTIITTHYIEEAKKANKVGLVRDGRILAEDQPESLLRRYDQPTLEDVFLHLCQNDVPPEKRNAVSYAVSEKASSNSDSLLEDNVRISGDFVYRATTKDANPKSRSRRISFPSWQRIFALVIKNFIRMSRRPSTVALQFFIPCTQIVLVCLAFSGNPHNLKVAVVNQDRFLGKSFLSYLDASIINQVPVNNLDTAEKMVIDGEVWGVIHIWKNFSRAIAKRFQSKDPVTPEMIDASNIYVRLDTTEQQNSIQIAQTIYKALQKFGTQTLGNGSAASIPVKIGEPLVGPNEANLVEYLAPGAVLIICFFMAVGLTALQFALERTEGVLDRSHVAGVTPFEVMASQILSQMGVMLTQVSLVVIVLVFGFDFPSEGNFIWVILLTVLQGICGMTFGYFSAMLVTDTIGILCVIIGCIFPALILSGIVWPIEAMPDYLAFFCQLLPQTYATKALRCVFSRGQDITFATVWKGYLVTIGWTGFFIACIILLLKVQDN